MFTGIIEAMGTVAALEPKGGDLRLSIETDSLDMSDVQLGDSIATSGVCLTVVDFIHKNDKPNGYIADVSIETLDLTTVGQWQLGQRVNLEKALTPNTRLGGHLVSGHVDGIGKVISKHIGDYAAGTPVNLEVDLIARYLERLLLGDKAAQKS